MKNPGIYDRYAKEEAAGYLAQLLAARCHLAGLRFGPMAEMDQVIGAIRHDLPVDAIAKLLADLAHERCACELTLDEDGEVDHQWGCRRGRAQAIIDTLRR
jgi:redox-regulated HSP33 family molecular chaperone